MTSHPIILYYSAIPGEPDAPRFARLEAALAYGRRTAPAGAQRLASLAGIALALGALSAVLGRAVAPGELRFAAGGKPVLPGGPDFSISHAAGWVGAASVARGAIGFDIESRAADRLTLNRVCDEVERSSIAAFGAAAMWVAKEAALKALGRSVRDAPQVRIRESIATCGERRLHLRRLDVLAGAVACLATEEPAAGIELNECAAADAWLCPPG